MTQFWINMKIYNQFAGKSSFQKTNGTMITVVTLTSRKEDTLSHRRPTRDAKPTQKKSHKSINCNRPLCTPNRTFISLKLPKRIPKNVRSKKSTNGLYENMLVVQEYKWRAARRKATPNYGRSKALFLLFSLMFLALCELACLSCQIHYVHRAASSAKTVYMHNRAPKTTQTVYTRNCRSKFKEPPQRLERKTTTNINQQSPSKRQRTSISITESDDSAKSCPQMCPQTCLLMFLPKELHLAKEFAK